MNFIWAKNGNEKNERFTFSLTLNKKCDTLVVCAVDFFRVFLDGEFLCFGPERTAAGYSKPKKINVKNTNTIKIEVCAYNVNCYACDRQSPFFGAEATLNGEVIYDTNDFVCERELCVKRDMPKYSPQRGFVESYDLTLTGKEKVQTCPVLSPIILNSCIDKCNYQKETFSLLEQGDFCGFYDVVTPYWYKEQVYRASPDGFDINRDFLEKTKIGYKALTYTLSAEHTGFLVLDITANTETEIFAVFEETFIDGKWVFCRSNCNDIFIVKTPKGTHKVISFEPYAFKHLKIIYKGECNIVPSMIKLENNHADFVSVKGNESIKKVFDAAKNTFCQNALDIFMDCPGRERAGWLCDSYFTAKAETLFTGTNDIEKEFLRNFILAKDSAGTNGMLPMCFPARQKDGWYIPNWSMWFVIELYEYLEQTNDLELINSAKEKTYNLVAFFDKYVNEYGLLEDLESWVFIEWSICNDKAYTSGVNFPSNILFAAMLERMGKMYNDESLIIRSKKINEQVLHLSYNGEFFADNAVRENGKLVRCDNHVSETCQYYALFFGLKPDYNFVNKMITKFGPLRKDEFLDIGKSNMFIGNYLRFFWLCEEGEYNRVLTEMVEYFNIMAEKTGTLWEHDSPRASCNHGFTSVAAVLILRCLIGYKTVKNKKPVLEDGFLKNGTYNVQVTWK